MTTDLLAKARAYEAKYGSRITDAERPVYHVTPTVGWLNDPNGFSYFDGKYHLFYQYNPYSITWNTMHWGHLVSEDLLHWKRLPAALAPSEKYDNFGIFSGSAITAPDGRHLLIYTGVEEFENEDGNCELRQTQCLAFGDGVDYVKYENNPVITPEMLPEGSSTADFRDPKIWYEEKEKSYYCVIGSSTITDGGTVVLFSSPDLYNWEYVSTLDRSRNDYGFMWECPDLFRLGDTDFIPLLPMKMFAKGLEFHSGNNAAYLAGVYDREKHTFVRRGIFSLDYGIDFYAPQSMVTPDGRRIMSAWMQTPETKEATPQDAKWFGQLIFPRELSERDGRLIQRPIREIEEFRKDAVFYEDVCIKDRTRLPGVAGRSVDLTVQVRPGGGTMYRKFTVKVAEDEELFTSITYDPAESILYFDRSYSGFMHYILSERKAYVRYRGGEITLRFLIDKFSVEVFVNDGEQTMSNTIYTRQSADGISFEADGGTAVIDVEKYMIEL
jgi:beta-fructofuranosidase